MVSPDNWSYKSRYILVNAHLYLLLCNVYIKMGMSKQSAIPLRVLWDIAVQSHVVSSVVTTSALEQGSPALGPKQSSRWDFSSYKFIAMAQEFWGCCRRECKKIASHRDLTAQVDHVSGWQPLCLCYRFAWGWPFHRCHSTLPSSGLQLESLGSHLKQCWALASANEVKKSCALNV